MVNKVTFTGFRVSDRPNRTHGSSLHVTETVRRKQNTKHI